MPAGGGEKEAPAASATLSRPAETPPQKRICGVPARSRGRGCTALRYCYSLLRGVASGAAWGAHGPRPVTLTGAGARRPPRARLADRSATGDTARNKRRPPARGDGRPPTDRQAGLGRDAGTRKRQPRPHTAGGSKRRADTRARPRPTVKKVCPERVPSEAFFSIASWLFRKAKTLGISAFCVGNPAPPAQS